ncbi:alpha/beta hydrolase [Candidatus Woesearchaeota archaeon]|nr:alpha/beta hydrolase [Candidatus Woesearchaeota archaeon]
MEKRIASFDGTKIYYLYNKNRVPLTLVFLHGVGGNWTVWKKEINYFQKQGFSTLAVDLRGHGLSDAPEEFDRYQLDYFSRDVHQILQTEKIKKFVLVGHSLGGGVAINYCIRYPKKLPMAQILVETTCLYPFDHTRLLNLKPYLNHFLRFIAEHKLTRRDHFFHFKEADLSAEGIRRDLHLISHLIHLTPLRTLVKALDNVEKYAFNNNKKIHDALRHLTIPVLIISGDEDFRVPIKYSLVLKKLICNSELKVIQGGCHLVTVTRAEEVSRIMHNFLLYNCLNAL